MSTDELKIGLVVMASGLGKRFGGNKLMEPLDNKPLIKWVIDATDNLFERRVVVTRNVEVRDMCLRLGIDCIIHELPNKNDTVRLGLSSIMESVDYCFFAPGDQPLVSEESFSVLINEAKKQKDNIVRAGYNNIVGAPIGFPKLLFDELLNLPEEKGGNFVVGNHQSLVHTVNVQDEYELWDVDTLSDLDKIKKLLCV